MFDILNLEFYDVMKEIGKASKSSMIAVIQIQHGISFFIIRRYQCLLSFHLCLKAIMFCTHLIRNGFLSTHT